MLLMKQENTLYLEMSPSTLSLLKQLKWEHDLIM